MEFVSGFNREPVFGEGRPICDDFKNEDQKPREDAQIVMLASVSFSIRSISKFRLLSEAIFFKVDASSL